jgi:hypothetical protein
MMSDETQLDPGILALVKPLARQAVREFLRSQSAAAAAGENSVQIASPWTSKTKGGSGLIDVLACSLQLDQVVQGLLSRSGFGDEPVHAAFNPEHRERQDEPEDRENDQENEDDKSESAAKKISHHPLLFPRLSRI